MYADDTTLFFSAKEVSDIERVLNTELELFHIWFQKNKLLVNIIKTEVVIFGTGPKLTRVAQFCVKIGQHQLKRVMEYNYLGVVLDDGLTWKTHVAISLLRSGSGKDCFAGLEKTLQRMPPT